MRGYKMENRKKTLESAGILLARGLFHISQLYLYVMAANLILAVGLFLIGKSIHWFLLPVSFAAGVILLLHFYDDEINWTIIYEIVGAILIFVVFAYLGGRLYDFSGDGNSYHKLAVGLLKNHWNPIKDESVVNYASNVLKMYVEEYRERWLQGYGKATWIFGASVYALTGNIETGKIYTILGMFSAFGLTCGYLKSCGKKAFIVVLMSLAAAMNPVALAQVDTFYNDGYLHLMLYIVVISLIMNVDPRHTISSKTSASLIASVMIVCANIKFTGLLYGGIYCIAYFIYYCVRSIRAGNQDCLRKCTFRCALFALLAVVSIGLAGAPTYVTNLIHHHTLTYPLTGDEPEDIMTENSPFTEENRVKNLLISTFSETCDITYRSSSTPQLKVPFTCDKSELTYMGGVDTRIGGFGIFFSGMLSLSIIVIFTEFWKTKRKTEKDRTFWTMNLIVILFLCVLIKESWWARYAPYLYFLFLIGLYFSFDIKWKIVGRFIVPIFSAVAILNSGLQLMDIPNTAEKTETAHKLFSALGKQDTVYLYSQRPGVYFNLGDYGVHFVVDSRVADIEEAQTLVWDRTKWSLEKPGGPE